MDIISKKKNNVLKVLSLSNVLPLTVVLPVIAPLKNTVKLFNFASGLFSQYSRGRYYRKNKLPQKFNTSITANGTS